MAKAIIRYSLLDKDSEKLRELGIEPDSKKEKKDAEFLFNKNNLVAVTIWPEEPTEEYRSINLSFKDMDIPVVYTEELHKELEDHFNKF